MRESEGLIKISRVSELYRNMRISGEREIEMIQSIEGSAPHARTSTVCLRKPARNPHCELVTQVARFSTGELQVWHSVLPNTRSAHWSNKIDAFARASLPMAFAWSAEKPEFSAKTLAAW